MLKILLSLDESRLLRMTKKVVWKINNEK